MARRETQSRNDAGGAAAASLESFDRIINSLNDIAKYLQVSAVTRTPLHYYFVIEGEGVFGGEAGTLNPVGQNYGRYTNFPSAMLTEIISREHYLFGYWYHPPEELDAAEWKQQAKAGLGRLFATYGPEYASSVMSWVERKAERVARRGRARP